MNVEARLIRTRAVAWNIATIGAGRAGVAAGDVCGCPVYSSSRVSITAIMAGSISAISNGRTTWAEAAPSQNSTRSARARPNIAAPISLEAFHP